MTAAITSIIKLHLISRKFISACSCWVFNAVAVVAAIVIMCHSTIRTLRPFVQSANAFLHMKLLTYGIESNTLGKDYTFTLAKVKSVN